MISKKLSRSKTITKDLILNSDITQEISKKNASRESRNSIENGETKERGGRKFQPWFHRTEKRETKRKR